LSYHASQLSYHASQLSYHATQLSYNASQIELPRLPDWATTPNFGYLSCNIHQPLRLFFMLPFSFSLSHSVGDRESGRHLSLSNLLSNLYIMSSNFLVIFLQLTIFSSRFTHFFPTTLLSVQFNTLVNPHTERWVTRKRGDHCLPSVLFSAILDFPNYHLPTSIKLHPFVQFFLQFLSLLSPPLYIKSIAPLAPFTRGCAFPDLLTLQYCHVSNSFFLTESMMWWNNWYVLSLSFLLLHM
jgi:hypothetical protein